LEIEDFHQMILFVLARDSWVEKIKSSYETKISPTKPKKKEYKTRLKVKKIDKISQTSGKPQFRYLQKSSFPYLLTKEQRASKDIIKININLSGVKLQTMWENSPFFAHGKPIGASHLRNFWRRMLEIADKKELYDEAQVEDLCKQCDEWGVGRLNFEEFILGLYFLTFKAKLSVCNDMALIAISPNAPLIQLFKKIREIPFEISSDVGLLSTLWKNAFQSPATAENTFQILSPSSDSKNSNAASLTEYLGTSSTSVPPIPSDLWKRLGFQSTSPEIDIRQTGRLGAQCLVNLGYHSRLFYRILLSSEIHQIPFALASLNATVLIYEMMGLGGRNFEDHPVCLPKTYKTLCNILLSDILQQQQQKQKQQQTLSYDIEDISLSSFYLLYYFIFGTMCLIWEETDATCADFTIVEESTREECEGFFTTFNDKRRLRKIY